MRIFIVADEWEPMDVLRGDLTGVGHQVHVLREQEAPDRLHDFGTGFMYVHRTLTAQLEQALVAFVQRGGRLIALHHGLASGKVRNPAWMELAGLHIEPRDAAVHPWRVISGVTHWLVNLAPDHPITTCDVEYDGPVLYTSSDTPSWPASLSALALPDTELFLNQHFTGGRDRLILFGSMCEDAETGGTVMQDRGGWIRRVGQGVLVYLQPGHSSRDFQHPGFAQILRNCVTWDGND